MKGRCLFSLGSGISLLICCQAVFSLDCPTAPQQVSKDWESQVNAAVATIGPVKGGDLTAKARVATQDLLGKLPDAGKIYLDQMMFSAYCSALRDDKTITEAEKAQRLKQYIFEVKRTISKPLSKPVATRQPGPQKTNPETEVKSGLTSKVAKPSSDPKAQSTNPEDTPAGRSQPQAAPSVPTQPEPPPSQSCPNGICVGGDNNGTATVNNYSGTYPPPGVVPTITICISRPEVTSGKARETVLRMETDTPISEPAWWFLFNGPVIDAAADADPKPFGYAHDHPPQDKRPNDWQNAVGITVTSIGGLFSQKPWRPGVPLTVTVTSNNPVELLEIAGRSLDQASPERFVFKCGVNPKLAEEPKNQTVIPSKKAPAPTGESRQAPRATGPATTSGSNSPAVTGNENTFTYENTPKRKDDR